VTGLAGYQPIPLWPERLLLVLMNTASVVGGVTMLLGGSRLLGALLLVRPLVVAGAVARQVGRSRRAARDQDKDRVRPATSHEVSRLTSLPAQIVVLNFVGGLLSWAGDAPAAIPLTFAVLAVATMLLWGLRSRAVMRSKHQDAGLMYRPGPLE
jgi:hypothetical protein